MIRSSGKTVDWLTFMLYLSLSVIGGLMVFAAEYPQSDFDWHYLFRSPGKQLWWVIISLGVLGLVFLVETKFWQTFAYVIYAFTLALLILVLFVGSTKKGATAWFNIGGFSLQPSELAKLGTCLALASYLGYYKTKLSNPKALIISLAIFLLPSALIILQPDAGSTLTFMSFFVVLFREGLNPNLYLVAILLITIFITSLIFPLIHLFSAATLITNFILLLYQKRQRNWWIGFAASLSFSIVAMIYNWGIESLIINLGMCVTLLFNGFKKGQYRTMIGITAVLAISMGFAFTARTIFDKVLEPHQKDRINVWLRPELSDPRGALYNVMQSKYAIGAGGFVGKGFLQGTMTKLNYVPEQSTDFIFSTIGEEQGFIGVTAIIIIFFMLILRITTIGERSKTAFGRTYAYSVAGFLFVHFFINIGMTMGLMPVIGIPLPLVSKGGTSLLTFSIMMGILLKMDLERTRG